MSPDDIGLDLEAAYNSATPEEVAALLRVRATLAELDEHGPNADLEARLRVERDALRALGLNPEEV
ncbi:hypothetical protein GO986_16495 [Deinococcus sp. HMF7620]|uniref:Uncharacterized protein n=1 Tax=Deinococcus arboris TaxID=2682977 RepID=A0A7C9IDI2_9DEIO|nr:hypothetical protein [Deinococcus arboris]MVN88346.1 hypothetical protein [Deinococcus arboris]